jgi:hypothetical protein
MFSARAVASVKPALSRAFSSTPRANVAKLTLVGRLGADPVTERIRDDTLMVKYVVGDRVKEGSEFKTAWYRVTNFVSEGTYGAVQMQRLKKGFVFHIYSELLFPGGYRRPTKFTEVVERIANKSFI